MKKREISAKAQALEDAKAHGHFTKRQLKDREKSYHYSADITKDSKKGTSHAVPEFHRIGAKIHRAHERLGKGLKYTPVRGLF
jgi:hypothetical protein